MIKKQATKPNQIKSELSNLNFFMKCISCLQNNNLLLNVYVQPRASKNRIAGMHGSDLKICVTAPPVENKANEAVVQFVAGLFGVLKSTVSIKSGRQGRNKKVLITNLTLSEAQEVLSRTLSDTDQV
jgi:uncharacterized protein (TIGR00251 family)